MHVSAIALSPRIRSSRLPRQRRSCAARLKMVLKPTSSLSESLFELLSALRVTEVGASGET